MSRTFPPAVGLSVMVAITLVAPARAADPITTGTLIAEMHDLERLTRFPDPPYKLVQFSSYDRRSNLPGGPEWFANSDGFGGEPTPGFEAVLKEPGADGVGEYLICDIKQPGAIVRTWTAAIDGKVQMFLDEAEQPVFDGSAQEFFERKSEYFVREAKMSESPKGLFQQRHADYLPIPFAKRCKVVWTGNVKKVHFYQLQARLYPLGTDVVTFQKTQLKAIEDLIFQVWGRMSYPLGFAINKFPRELHAKINPFESTPPLVIEGGPLVIIDFAVHLKAAEMPKALRGTALRIHFDGAPVPQVHTPIGDFFAAAPGVVPCGTFPMRVAENGRMSCSFFMPFEKQALIQLDNRTDREVEVELTTFPARPYEWSDRSMHFHAKWRVNHDLIAKPDKEAIDLPFIIARGKGMYVGTAVYLMNPSPVPTAGGNWWGEGDEKIFVDDDKLPSHFGTGSEDYFNYAWSSPDIFQFPYFSQPICTGPDPRGYITNNRWHIIDSIPFENFLAFYMELWSHTNTPHLSYARMSYWYARPGAIDDHVPPQDSDLRVPPLPEWKPVAVGQAAEATFFEAEDILSSRTGVEIESDVLFSGGKAVRWRPETGARLADMKLPVEKAGKYRVVMTCISEDKPAGFRARFDAATLKHHGDKEDVELHTSYLRRLVNIWFEPMELTAGEHTLSLDALNGAPGVDFVWLKPAK